MMPQHKLKREIAKKYGISLTEMDEMILSQDLFVAEVIKNKADRENYKFPSVRLPGFGIFYASDKKVERFKKLNKDPHVAQ